MRTFLSGDQSRRFWNIALKGKRYTVQYGPLFTKGRTQVKVCASAAEAKASHDRLVRQRLASGYVETTPPPIPALQQSLLDALVANPDDLAAHMAYADYLMEQEDPRGEFIQVQLALEGLTRTSKKKTALEQRFWALLGANQRQWLGELGVWLLDRPQRGTPYEFRRGWLDALTLEDLSAELARVVVRAPQVRTLRIVGEVDDETYDKPLLCLMRLGRFPNVRVLVVDDLTLLTADLKGILTSTALPRLEYLSLAGLPLSGWDWKAIARSGILGRLKVLELARCGLEDSNVHLLICPELKHLERLNLNGNRLTEGAFKMLRDAGIAFEAEPYDNAWE